MEKLDNFSPEADARRKREREERKKKFDEEVAQMMGAADAKRKELFDQHAAETAKQQQARDTVRGELKEELDKSREELKKLGL